MSKKIIRLTESELKNYIHKVVSEQVKTPTGDFTTIGRFGTYDAKTLKERGFTVKGGVAILNHPNPKLVVTVKPSQKGWAAYQGGVLKFDLPHDDCDVQLDKLIGYNSLHGGYKTGLKEQQTPELTDYDKSGDPERKMFNDIFGGGAELQYKKQTGEPIIPYEKKGLSVPTSSISPEDLAKSIAGIAKLKKDAEFLQYIKQWGHTSKDTWDASFKGEYYPYTSPELRKKAKKGGYFPYPNMASKRADDAKRNNNRPPMRRTPPQQPTFRINPTLSFDQNVYVIQQQIRRDLTPKEKSQIDKAITDAKTRASLNQGQQRTPSQQQPTKSKGSSTTQFNEQGSMN